MLPEGGGPIIKGKFVTVIRLLRFPDNYFERKGTDQKIKLVNLFTASVLEVKGTWGER